MNLDELRSAQSKERRKDSLQHLRDSFYDDVAAYVADLRAARDRRAEQVAKPFSDDDVRRMSDEVEAAEEVAEALYERRVGKVVKLASFAAADMSVDADGMTTEERQLFDDLVDRITENKSNVLDVLAGEEPPGSTDTAPPDVPPEETGEAPPGAIDATDATDAASSDGRAIADSSAPSPGDPSEPSPHDGDGLAGTEETAGSADALAGAMGGSDEAVSDALDAAVDGESRTAEGPDRDTDSTAPDGPTPVPPEPAPPGAPGADANDAQAGGDAQRGSEKPDHGADGRDASADEAPPDEAPPDEAPGRDPPAGRATVRITRDVGAIFGVDEREYDLASEDVVTLPAENADPLVQRDAAERLD